MDIPHPQMGLYSFFHLSTTFSLHARFVTTLFLIGPAAWFLQVKAPHSPLAAGAPGLPSSPRVWVLSCLFTTRTLGLWGVLVRVKWQGQE